MFMRKILLFFAVAVAANAGPITWTLSDAVFGDGGTAVGSFVYDWSIQTVLSYSILTSGGNETDFPPFLFQNGGPNNIGVSVAPGPDYISFYSNFTNGNPNGLDLRLGPVSGLTDAGGVVDLDLSDSVQCYNCSPFRLFVSGQMIAEEAAVPEPSTVALTLLPLALGVILARRHRNTVLRKVMQAGLKSQ